MSGQGELLDVTLQAEEGMHDGTNAHLKEVYRNTDLRGLSESAPVSVPPMFASSGSLSLGLLLSAPIVTITRGSEDGLE